MSRRTRALAGLLSLTAMTASFSQAVVASMCASPDGMGTMAGMAMSAASVDQSPTANHHEMACAGMGHADQSRGSGGPCPLTPAATQGCTAPASVPAPALAIGLGVPLGARHDTFDDREPELLLADALYHPPRA